MVSRMLFAVLAAAVSVPAHAGVVKKAERPAWRFSVDVVDRYVAYGYEPVYIVETRGKEHYDARTLPRLRGSIRGRLVAESDHLRIDIEPYTVVPSDVLRVNAAGVEVDVLFPIKGFGYVGFYHHSSHNFSFGGFGYGINLNAVVIDARWHQSVDLWGSAGDLRLRWLFHAYLAGDAPAHVLTAHADLDLANVGHTIWRSDLDAVLHHPKVRAECGISVRSGSPGMEPDSVRFDCAGMHVVGPWLGTFGDHLYVGPFVAGGINLTQTTRFGRSRLSAGIRLDLVMAENAFLR